MHKVYMSGKAGPFRCDHCEYYPAEGRCNNTHIVALARAGKFGLKLAGGRAVVDPGGCSDEFELSAKAKALKVYKR